MAGDPADFWHSLLQPEFDRAPDFAGKFFARLRDAKLVFGDRVHCPFPRPFFLTEEDEARVRVVAETIASLGERVVVAALENRALFEQLHLRPEEDRLARIPHLERIRDFAGALCKTGRAHGHRRSARFGLRRKGADGAWQED